MKFPEEFRIQRTGFTSNTGDPYGCFFIPGRNANGRGLSVIACDGDETGWEHVSVSLPESPKKCPSWDEMCIVKKLFWDDDECVVQFHPQESEYVNIHPGVLHLWKFVSSTFPTPPRICV